MDNVIRIKDEDNIFEIKDLIINFLKEKNCEIVEIKDNKIKGLISNLISNFLKNENENENENINCIRIKDMYNNIRIRYTGNITNMNGSISNEFEAWERKIKIKNLLK